MTGERVDMTPKLLTLFDSVKKAEQNKASFARTTEAVRRFKIDPSRHSLGLNV
jgi:hypothetical protein